MAVLDKQYSVQVDIHGRCHTVLQVCTQESVVVVVVVVVGRSREMVKAVAVVVVAVILLGQ